MTKLLKEAFDRAAQLPDEEQGSLAAILLEEFQGEARWRESFRRTESKLAELAEEALAEYRASRTTPLDFNRKQ